MTGEKIRVGVYGSNGHQIQHKLLNQKDAELTAVCMIPESVLQDLAPYREGKLKVYGSLSEMLEDKEIDLVSLCSPMRSDQAKDAITCMKAGKHVYAEKPGALSEEELEQVLAVSKETGCEFHEMADTVFEQPYWSVRHLIRSGKIGRVVQVYVQKSYPLNVQTRPQNEVKDGGLVRWVGIHAMRFLEHLTGEHVKEVKVYQTHMGNMNEEEGLFTASSWAMTLENGGVASACVNYLNPKGFGQWGNETVRVFGTKGMIEVTDGKRHSHLYTEEEDLGEVDPTVCPCEDFFGLYAAHLRYGTPMPMDTEEELHPLRVVLRAFENTETTEVRSKA